MKPTLKMKLPCYYVDKTAVNIISTFKSDRQQATRRKRKFQITPHEVSLPFIQSRTKSSTITYHYGRRRPNALTKGGANQGNDKN